MNETSVWSVLKKTRLLLLAVGSCAPPASCSEGELLAGIGQGDVNGLA